MRALIVEDELRYRDYLAAHLQAQGMEVCSASDGDEAIRLGLEFRPQILVADWMLGQHLHGLHVADVLAAVDPELRTILITGFASADLAADARRSSVVDVIEKPFRIDRLRSAVTHAAEPRPGRRPHTPFAVIECDADGVIDRMNDLARALAEEAGAGSIVARLDGLLSVEGRSATEASFDSWVEVDIGQQRWWTRAVRTQRGALHVYVSGERPFVRDDPRLQTLLGVPSAARLERLRGDAVLVLDEDPGIRKLYATQLERLGCVCYKADSTEMAARLFRGNPSIGVVILDYEMCEDQLAGVLSEFGDARPRVRIVGSSASPRRRSDFADVGVDRFLAKPWEVDDLLGVLEP